MLGILFNTLKSIQGTAEDCLFLGHQFKLGAIGSEPFKNFQKCCFYTGLVVPFAPFSFLPPKKKVTVTAVQYILSESLKQSNDV